MTFVNKGDILVKVSKLTWVYMTRKEVVLKNSFFVSSIIAPIVIGAAAACLVSVFLFGKLIGFILDIPKKITAVKDYFQRHEVARELILGGICFPCTLYLFVVEIMLLQISAGVETPRIGFWMSPLAWVAALLVVTVTIGLAAYFDLRQDGVKVTYCPDKKSLKTLNKELFF